MPVNYYRTPVGIARIIEDDGYISSISIRDEELAVNEPETELLKTVAAQLDEYFAGNRKTFDFPIKQAGTGFQQEVWENLLKIPYGVTTSYAKLSQQMKNPLAIRAIAAACSLFSTRKAAISLASVVAALEASSALAEAVLALSTARSS
ncbi:MAG: hypothetical protein EOO38_01860 [Cytophagaceae bacterium]|nr:MAG: hypothetical protein EOO38_01860 [Cytophagaceae bacterium]